MNLLDFIYQYFGEWIADYPYMVGTIELVLTIIALIFLYNFCYWLIRLLGGER